MTICPNLIGNPTVQGIADPKRYAFCHISQLLYSIILVFYDQFDPNNSTSLSISVFALTSAF